MAVARAVQQQQPQILRAIHPEQDPTWQTNRARALVCATEALQPQSSSDGLIAGVLGLLGLAAMWRAL